MGRGCTGECGWIGACPLLFSLSTYASPLKDQSRSAPITIAPASNCDKLEHGSWVMKNRRGCKGYVIEARSYELRGGGFSAEFSIEEHDGAGVTETGVAPTSPGGNADASDESVTSDRHERRRTAQARAVDRKGTGATGVVAVASLDHSAPARTAGAAGPLRPEHRSVEPGDRARSCAGAGGATAANPSWRGADHGAGLCAGPGHPRVGLVAANRWPAIWD